MHFGLWSYVLAAFPPGLQPFGGARGSGSGGRWHKHSSGAFVPFNESKNVVTSRGGRDNFFRGTVRTFLMILKKSYIHI